MTEKRWFDRCDVFKGFLCYTESVCAFTSEGIMEFERRPLRGSARERFRALLTLASESPFEGERQNAMAAATRLAEQHGMSLEQAARPTARSPADRPLRPNGLRTEYTASDGASYFDSAERSLRADKAQRDSALRDAIDRGLDSGGGRREEKTVHRKSPSSRTQRNPLNYARVLLAETSFSLKEIIDLTGLDVYQVVGLKLKMRSAA